MRCASSDWPMARSCQSKDFLSAMMTSDKQLVRLFAAHYQSFAFITFRIMSHKR
jgi:hypothetical protein